MTEQDCPDAAFVPSASTRDDEQRPLPDVVVYGLAQPQWLDTWGRPYLADEDGRVYVFEDVAAAVRMHESRASLFILPFEGGAAIETKGRPPSAPLASCDQTEFTALCKVIPLALQRGALVCFLIRPSTPLVHFTKGGDKRSIMQQVESQLSFYDNVIGYRLLDEPNALIEPNILLKTDVRAKIGELIPFFEKYGATKFEMKPRKLSFSERTMVLATSSGDEAVALARENERGVLFWLPMRNATDGADFAGAITTLGRCLSTFRSKSLTEEPEWAREQFLWTGEERMRQRKAEALETLESVEPVMGKFTQLRRILWTRDKTLEGDLAWFLEQMGLSVEAHETYKEDFWLLVEGARQAIGEVKAINGNVKPSDLAHVVSHRKAAGKPDEFPTVFVANTFANTDKVEKRRVEPNVCRRAKEDNVLVMRTLDLARLYDGMMKGLDGFDLENIWTHLRSGGGWLHIEAERISLKTN